MKLPLEEVFPFLCALMLHFHFHYHFLECTQLLGRMHRHVYHLHMMWINDVLTAKVSIEASLNVGSQRKSILLRIFCNLIRVKPTPGRVVDTGPVHSMVHRVAELKTDEVVDQS